MLKQTLRLIVLSLSAMALAAPAALAAFDPRTERVFVTDAEHNQLDVFDFSDPATPSPLVPIELSPYGAGPNSVVYLPELRAVAVAVEAANVGEPGAVAVFDAKKGTHLVSFPAGPLPDMVTVTEDGRYLLVANEGEPADDGSVDPEGSVTVIDLRR